MPETIHLRLSASYPNPFWNSGTGLTLRKDDRAGVRWSADDSIVQRALRMNILEPVPSDENDVVILRDTPAQAGVIREVFTPSNVEPVKEAIAELKAPAKKRGKKTQ